MSIGIMFVFMVALVLSSTDATAGEPSIAHTVFLPREFDPFCDVYVETVTRMSADELMHLPQLNDTDFLDHLVRGTDTIPALKSRAGPNNLFDPNFDEQVRYQPEIETEWEDLMVGGPASINYMGAVMAIASKNDFSLKSDFDYKLVKYPHSFQTTLVQVANDMYRALYGAHTGMDKMQASIRQIPTLLNTALKLITQASTSMTKAMLPRTLTNIGRYANESATVARATLERFDNLQELLQEIVVASTLTNSDNRQTAENLAAQNEEMRVNKMNMDIAIAEMKAKYETAQQDLEKARQDYHAAMVNVPGGEWNSHAWDVYASHRPAVSCNYGWFWRYCRSVRDQQFVQYSNEARQKAQQALDILKRAEDRSKELFNLQMNKQDEIGIAMTNLATINFNEISINQTIKILLDAAEKIALVQEQWGRITRFFSKLAIETETTQKVVLENFLGVIADAEGMGKSLDPIDKTLYVLMLVESATDIDRDSHLLFLMAKTYTDVSNEYMMDQITGISGLLTLQNDADRDTYVKGVAAKASGITKKVKNLAAERQRKYESVSFSRQEQYMEFIQDGMMKEQLDIFGNSIIGRRK